MTIITMAITGSGFERHENISEGPVKVIVARWMWWPWERFWKWDPVQRPPESFLAYFAEVTPMEYLFIVVKSHTHGICGSSK